MARELILVITDDFDKTSPADESRVLGWDGYDYVLDLTTENDKKLQELLQPYLEAAHEKVKQKNPKTRKKNPDEPVAQKTQKELRAAIREWANANGYKVGEKGIIAKRIVDAYAEAH